MRLATDSWGQVTDTVLEQLLPAVLQWLREGGDGGDDSVAAAGSSPTRSEGDDEEGAQEAPPTAIPSFLLHERLLPRLLRALHSCLARCPFAAGTDVALAQCGEAELRAVGEQQARQVRRRLRTARGADGALLARGL